MDQRVTHHDQQPEIPVDGGIDLASALQRLGGDEQLLRDMAQIVIEDAPGLLEQARASRNGDNADAAWRAAHSLKGLTSNFSEHAAAAAQAAETALRQGDQAQIDPALAVLQTYVERLFCELQRSVLRS